MARIVNEYCVSLATVGIVPDNTALYVEPLGLVVDPIVTPVGRDPETGDVDIVEALSAVMSKFAE